MLGKLSNGNDHRKFDGFHVGPNELHGKCSEAAMKLCGRDISELSVTAKQNRLVYITVRFAAEQKDLDTILDLADQCGRQIVTAEQAAQRAYESGDGKFLNAVDK